jgi:hypothetical protein
MSERTKKTSVWGGISLPANEFVDHKIGPLHIMMKRTSNEIWVSFDRTQVEEPGPEVQSWTRWALTRKDSVIEVWPLMPDLQVIVRPEYPFSLAPGAAVKVFTRIPVWVGVFAHDPRKHKLTETPTVQLSKTWYGDFTDGVMCYWIGTTARREVSQDVLNDYTAVASLNIKNESDTDLKIEKLSIRVDRLSLFESEGFLWTDEMDIRYHGEDQHSEITMNGKAPKDLQHPKLITSPRDPLKKSFAERTFRIIKEIPGLS